MTTRTACMVLAAVCLAAALPACQNPGGTSTAGGQGNLTTPPATQTVVDNEPLPKDVQQALEKLSSQDLALRQEALKTLADAINSFGQETEFLQEVVGRIQVRTGLMVEQMSRTNDREARNRIAQVLEFNESLSRFAVEMADIPKENRDLRDKMLAWGLSEKGFAIVGKAFSRSTDRRVEAARALAHVKGPEADKVLARLVNDEDREVSIIAMDTCYDREPNQTLVDALWEKSIEIGTRQFYQNYGVARRAREVKVVKVHGREIQVNEYDYSLNNKMQDGELAVDALIHYKSPMVEQKLGEFFAELGSAKSDPNGYRFRVLSTNYGGTVAYHMNRLLDAYHPKEVVPVLLRIAMSPTNDGYNNPMGGQMLRYSTRIDALGLLVKLTDQDKDEYKLVHVPNYGNRWMIQGTEVEENAAVKKMKAWWDAHYKEYGASDSKIDPDEPLKLRPVMSGRKVIID